MNIIDMFLINMLLMAVPLLIYMVYITTNRNLNEKERNLFFMLSLITSYFLMIHYSLFKDVTMMLLFSGVIIYFIRMKKFTIFTIFVLVMNVLTVDFSYLLLLTYIFLVFIRNNKIFIIGYWISFIIYRFLNDYLLVETIFLSVMFLITIL